MEKMMRRFVLAAPLLVGLTLVFAASYVNEQQMVRQGAYEPQVETARDLAAARAAGAPALATNADAYVDLAQDQTPFVVFYDRTGAPVSGTGYLNGTLPQLPSGIFAAARARGEDRITWQPQAGVRLAIAVEPVNQGADGYVMAGRSMRFIEWEEDQLAWRTLAEWLVTMVAVILAYALAGIYKQRHG